MIPERRGIAATVRAVRTCYRLPTPGRRTYGVGCCCIAPGGNISASYSIVRPCNFGSAFIIRPPTPPACSIRLSNTRLTADRKGSAPPKTSVVFLHSLFSFFCLLVSIYIFNKYLVLIVYNFTTVVPPHKTFLDFRVYLHYTVLKGTGPSVSQTKKQPGLTDC